MLEEGLFAVHSGTTINIFLKDLPAMAQFKVPVGFSQHLGLRGQRLEMLGAENGGYPPTQNGDIRSLFWLFSLMALQN